MNDRLERLHEVLAAYGASEDCWPVEDRAALLTLLEESEPARALRDEAADLDSLLDLGGAIDAPTRALKDRILDAAPGGPAPKRTWRWAPLVPIAAAAALALWIAAEPRAPQVAEAPIEIAIADLGIYTTPTDVLLATDGFDPLASVPAYDCEGSGLGCPELDLDA
ncbi:MAG: hypothetical protein P8R42_26195 [Candidatus Binatia bacterium]|nr:hypothetical protein [Candidatus Binatia bacterium]